MEAGDSNSHEIWKVLYNIIQLMGPQGVSSNDSNSRPGHQKEANAKHLVHILKWWSYELLDLLVWVDKQADIFTVYGNQRPGGQAHACERPCHPIVSR